MLRKRLPERQIAITVAVVLTLILAGLLVLRNSADSSRFSESQYGQVEERGRQAFKQAGADEFGTDKFCRMRSPGKFERERLYCTIQIGAYFRYGTDGKAIAAVKTIETSLSDWATINGDVAAFYQDPRDASISAYLTVRPPLPQESCNLTIDSNRRARIAIAFMPEPKDDDSLAVSVSCNPPSRGQYFPLRD